MNIRYFLKCVLVIIIFCYACKRNKEANSSVNTFNKNSNQVKYANGFELYDYETYKVLKIVKPYSEAAEEEIFILANEKKNVPDSLSNNLFIQIPIQKIVVTSTTHIPSLVNLSKENTLIGFPGLDYISSPSVRQKIEEEQILELGQQGELSVEKTLQHKPNVVVAHSSGQPEPKMNQLKDIGIPVIYNGDWQENTPLGKAEWIKLFGALYDKTEEADIFFKDIVKEYEHAKSLVPNNVVKPTVMSGAMYESIWYLPQGESWMSVFIKDAGGNYLWSDIKGSGSISLSFEAVYETAKEADYWIGTSQFVSYDEMISSNGYYEKFDSFKNKKVFTSASKKGPTGGLLIYEEAPNRPDIVLKDLIKIFYPEKLPEYTPYFFEPMQ